MADFNISIRKTLVNEGGYTNDPNDAGGETNYGISKRQFPNLDIKNLTANQAVEIYREGYWKTGYSQINSQAVADKLFDMGVLFGVSTTVRILQTVLDVTADSIFGPGTLDKVNTFNESTLLQSFKAGLVHHAVNIVGLHPQDDVFLTGWVRRINS